MIEGDDDREGKLLENKSFTFIIPQLEEGHFIIYLEARK
jgi:hypothetical protein